MSDSEAKEAKKAEQQAKETKEKVSAHANATGRLSGQRESKSLREVSYRTQV
jgi:hypothetical protein